MKIPSFPDSKVLNYIEQIEKLLPNNTVYLSFIEKRQEGRHIFNDTWEWQFKMTGSNISLEIGVSYPDLLINVFVKNNGEVEQTKTSELIFFESYLKHINAKEDLAVINAISTKNLGKMNGSHSLIY